MFLQTLSTWTKVIILFTAVSLLSYSCKDDDTPNDTITTLSYDGDNVTAPFLPARTFEGAARFTATQLEPYIGDELSEVEFYIQDMPTACEVRIYTSNSGTPSNSVYIQNVTNSISANGWNRHVLSEPYIIDGQDLWVSIRFSQSNDQRTLGCDIGPAAINGDWTYDSDDQAWIPLVQRTNGQININWNIRAIVDVVE